MMKQRPTMEQRLAIIGELSIVIRAIQDSTLDRDGDSLAGVASFIKENDCSGHFFTNFEVSELVHDVTTAPRDQAIYAAALLIFIFSDTK
jgi:hypothetical protein